MFLRSLFGMVFFKMYYGHFKFRCVYKFTGGVVEIDINISNILCDMAHTFQC